jgi:3-oxoadipate enol-lactonase
MPDVPIRGGTIAYTVEGDRDRPALLLSHALGTNGELWNPQRPDLTRAFRVISYDTRGHGASSAPPGDYTVDQLGHDALAVLDAAGVDRAAICGLSLGALTAIWLAQHAAPRVTAIVLANTAARIGSPAIWQDRRDLVMTRGLAPVAETGPERWFTEPFRRARPDEVARCRQMLLGGSASGYAACAAALRDADLRPDLGRIDMPVLVVIGQHDPVTTVADGEALRNGIRGARAVTLNAAHFSNIEQPEAFTQATVEFLTERDSVSA